MLLVGAAGAVMFWKARSDGDGGADGSGDGPDAGPD
jgi:hypothetical protein